jgi:hypothetical protein
MGRPAAPAAAVPPVVNRVAFAKETVCRRKAA